MDNYSQSVKMQLDKELSRFGHTVTLINKNTAVLFGGAKGQITKFELCNDVFTFQIANNTWVKLNPSGDIPCIRAAHAAAALDTSHLVVFGGTTSNGALAGEDLHLLDLSQGENNALWITYPVTGPKPGGRHGHSLCYLKPHLILFGGNLGKRVSNEVWICTLSTPAKWVKLDIKGNLPIPRMYHSGLICGHGGAKNMMLVFGGRDEKTQALNDCWGLRQHQSGIWDWVRAPYSKEYEPMKRFLHSINFFYTFLIIIGGKVEGDNKLVPIEVYDTETSEWEAVTSFKIFRHTSFTVGDVIYSHGGFDLINPNYAKKELITIDLIKLFNSNETLKRKLEKLLDENKKKQSQNKLTPTLSPVTTSEPIKHRTSANKQMLSNKVKKDSSSILPMASLISKPLIQKKGEMAHTSTEKNELIIKEITFDDKWSIQEINAKKEKPLHDLFLDYLLQPALWMTKEDEAKKHFHFSIDQIAQLIKQCIDIVAAQPNVLRVSAPVKVFGDIHGQYLDLMNFFNKWGLPSEGVGGDITSNDYLFLGDYVDRGNLNLETICLLISLKIKYPDQIHLLRGNHEDILINSSFGFQLECETRLDDDSDSDDSLFCLFNYFFEYLPLAAVIEEQILCLHGGIGKNVKLISDIENIPRPFEVIHEATTPNERLVMDILWSDPTDTDEELGIQPNLQRDSNDLGHIVKFGPDIVKEFLGVNGLSYIIRAHECVLDGFERFAGGMLITVFSATDYCGRHKNAGAMIIINQQQAMIPHLIYPPDGGNLNWIDDEEYYQQRPPTPPRVRFNKQSY